MYYSNFQTFQNWNRTQSYKPSQIILEFSILIQRETILWFVKRQDFRWQIYYPHPSDS